ncbi:MAG: phosphopantetheine-binding protein [Verrucomicrobiota bacterium]
MSTLIENNSIREELVRVLRPNLKFLPAGEAIDPEASLGELGLDSLASVNLLFDLESELNISIPDDVLDENTFSSLQHLESVLTRLAAEQQ